MNIYVDADACPAVIRDILFRVAQRQQIKLILIANRLVNHPPSIYIQSVRVADGFDVADDEIVRRCKVGDLIISADIPLAAEAIEKGALVLSPRGELFTPENIRERLNMRDFMDTMRSSGVHHAGPAPLGQRDRKAFADTLDRILARRK
ncbi:YaiI/YqxD family protein [Aliidiomarina quisquiliarum]|uniref:YaiI/YqxD family protein n=1 Tax=Aliidiomarina quisquiliarum TaxID=2938947 RepID=UPI00208F107C|nr:YaiI/YqxD family protein [Aliidiomarina quisquiliarum]MCO4321131.1 YaiI/YqxD family protein [Aliidiomarina quisquiliarum]